MNRNSTFGPAGFLLLLFALGTYGCQRHSPSTPELVQNHRTGVPPTIRLVAFAPPQERQNPSASAGGEEAEKPSALDAMPCADWEKPVFALVCTGRQYGYIEPCGCTGLENQTGGLSRRHGLLTYLRDRGWDVVPIDVGNQVRRLGPQAEIKLQTTCNLLREMRYAAVGLGPDDLRLSIGELAATIAGDGAAESLILTSANANLLDLNPRFRIVEAAGRKIGIVSVIGDELQQQVNSPEISFMSADAAIKEVMPELKKARVNHLVLLAYTTTEDTRRLAKEFPEFEVIVTAGGAGEPTLEPERVAGSNAQIIQVGAKGMYAGILGFYPQLQPAFRYQRVDLDARFPDSKMVMEHFALYQRQLQDMGLAGLGVRPVKHPSGHTFVGHETCRDCHLTAYEIFEDTQHFQATNSIAKPTQRSNIPRHFDPECLSCHVTGWNPQGYFAYESGYESLEKSKLLHSVGCEDCHGPGSAHVAAETGDVDVSDEERRKLRAEMRITLEESKKSQCFDCHDQDNSPEFDFDTYWEEVKHYGMD